MKRFTMTVILIFLCCFGLPIGALAADALIPVGQVVGLQITDNKVIIAGFDGNLGTAAQTAGLKTGDRLTHINGREITCPADVARLLQTEDESVEVRFERDGKTKSTRFVPVNTDDGRKLGVYLKQGISGIGTITWYDPENKSYGALGHGVNNGNGQLIPIGVGEVYKASVLSVIKGKSGDPGQLLGNLKDKTPIGTITKNTQQGIFGKVQDGWAGKALPVANKNEVKTGKATIRSNVSGETVQEYSVEILKIYPNCRGGGRNMLIKITDPALLSVTNGIVQGMSGSPIIQDGKLIGAVTHVLVNDPTTGYGIFIENMLDAAA